LSDIVRRSSLQCLATNDAYVHSQEVGLTKRGEPSSSFDWSSCACLEDDKENKWDLMRSVWPT